MNMLKVVCHTEFMQRLMAIMTEFSNILKLRPSWSAHLLPTIWTVLWNRQQVLMVWDAQYCGEKFYSKMSFIIVILKVSWLNSPRLWRTSGVDHYVINFRHWYIFLPKFSIFQKNILHLSFLIKICVDVFLDQKLFYTN